MNIEVFAKRLSELREEKNIKKVDLARELKVSKSTITNYEKAKQKPTLEHLIIISKVLNASVDYLLGLEYSSVDDYFKDEFILKSIKRNSKVYEYLLNNTRQNIKNIEKIIK